MLDYTVKPYCGPPVMPWSALFSRRGNGALRYLPGGPRVYLTRRGRTAIHLACQLLNLRPGDEILAPAFNCGSEIDPLIWSGANIVLYNVDRSLRFDIGEIEERLHPGVRGVYVIHYWGFLQPLERLRELCQGRGVALIEDCALSLFSRGPEGPAGSTGDMAVFSFPKSLPVSDGGALVVNNGELPEPRRLPGPSWYQGGWRLWGLVRAWLVKSHLWNTGHYLSRDYVLAVGEGQDRRNGGGGRPGLSADSHYRSRHTRGISYVSRWLLNNLDVSEITKVRRRNYEILLKLLRGVEGVLPVCSSLPEGTCPLVFPILLPDRERVCVELNRRGISAIPWWYDYHPAVCWDDYADACYLKDQVLAIRVNQDLTADAMAYTADVVKAAVGGVGH